MDRNLSNISKTSLTLVFVTLLSIMGFAQNTVSLDAVGNNAEYVAGFPGEADYISFLQKFPIYAERRWHDGYKDNPQIGYFGSGLHGYEEMRCLSNFIFVYALLAVDENYDESVSGVGQDTLLEHTRAALRYFTSTHVSGDMLCVDSSAWGQQPGEWLTPWVISKAVAGARLIWDKLTQTEKYDIQRVVIHEADYQLTNRASSQEYVDTDAEYNALNGEVLAWASSLYPDHPRAGEWRSKAQEFFMNTLSVQGDRSDARVVDGQPVNRWVYTTNVHPDFTLEGHGAYSFDYTACPLHSMAWSYYAFTSNGQPVPQSLFHHVVDVWETLKKTHLYSGRFACFQGKDWARYVYGSYFIMPALVVFENEFNDADARLIEQLRFHTFQYEQDLNVDGSVFGQRFGVAFEQKFPFDARGWPIRYETDCYANVGLAYLLHKFAPPTQAESMDAFQRKVEGSFHSEYCDFLYTRSQELFASFSWRNLFNQDPMALFIPGDDHMAEWSAANLIGYAKAEGFDLTRTPVIHNEIILEDGSDTGSSAGLMGFTTTGLIHEGKSGATYAIDHYVSFTALPKRGLAVMIEYLLAREDIALKKQAGLYYSLPNDVFNDRERRIYGEDDELRLSGFGNRDPVAIDSKWINVDDKLGMIALLDNGQFKIEAMSGRSLWIGMTNEQISYSSPSKSLYETGEVIRDQCYILISGDSSLTRNFAESGAKWQETGDEFIKAVAYISGGFSDLIIANFHQEPMQVTTQFCDGEQVTTRIPALETVVLSHPAAGGSVAIWSGGTRDDAEPVTWDEEKGVKLFQNYPNPCNPVTWIPFQLGQDSDVSVRVHDVKGNIVRTLQLGRKKAGSYLTNNKAAYWDGRNENGETVANGVYFYSVKAGRHVSEARKMALGQ